MNELSEIKDALLPPAMEMDPDIDIASEIDSALVGLLKNQIAKLEEEDVYERTLKEALITRLPEASFSEIADALTRSQVTQNTKVERILAPFIPKGERTPLLEDKNRSKKSADEEIFNTAGKDMLRSIEELSKVVKEISKPAEKDDIKAKLGIVDSVE